MATFSTNQVRHLYVLKNFQEASSITSFKNAGETVIGATKDANDVFIKYIGMGGQVRTDLIPKSKVLSATLLTKDKDRTPLKSVLVQLNAKVNAAPITSQDYILRIAFRQYFGMSDEDLYLKYGMVHAYAGMTNAVFYAKLAQSLAKNFSRELVKPLAFHLVKNEMEDVGEVTATSKIKYDSSFKGTADFDATTDSYTGIVIKEVDQKDEWVLGTKEQTPVYFTVQPTTIMVSGDELIWGKVTKLADSTSDPKKYIGNGTKIADLEYFCMGERGDIYRNINWPNAIRTKYMVDPTKEYNIVDIHYYQDEGGENPQKSEKTITFVYDNDELTDTITTTLSRYGIGITKV